ncbi:V-type proton ATPase subunit e 1 [Geodia barretti]|uniref:V-type proton ATPase subunit e 1 n=1 Tax=Geodia barretti TaxID=519541 RepID=A0AA35WTF7_GEOBA|nr:V-type proton ATPase subunit e 1 [Geodia barretti]
MFNSSLFVALPIITIFWVAVFIAGFIVPFLIPKNPNRWTIGTMIATTAICCYVFWLIAFLAQLNPLIGPEVPNAVAAHMRRAWLGWKQAKTYDTCYPSW